ncbi:MAG: hypothetical protein KGJ59_06900, partial [Bacteroidota bacterium]|nr:hypothetical protein [Bacteroidota bacterium]
MLLFSVGRKKISGIGGHLIATGVAVFVITIILSNVGFVREGVMNSYFYEIVSGLTHFTPKTEKSAAVVNFWLFTRNNDQKEYFEDCLKITQDLKKASANAIMIE